MKKIYLNCSIHLRNYFAFFFILILVIWVPANTIAQPIPVGDYWDNQYRTLQLLADSSTVTSFTNRPIWQNTYFQVLQENKPAIAENPLWTLPENPKTLLLKGSFIAGIYNPVFTISFNSDLPYGENNGAAWYGRGVNTELQAGGWITSDYLTVTFRPHLSYQQNTDFTKPRFIPRDSDGNPRYRSIVPGIDMPYRFGPDPFTTLELGQSSIRIHYKAIEAGAAKENLWWGPGQQYALMMSNNAPGIKHLFLGTRSPVSLPLNIGNIEFRLIGGWPEESDYYDQGGNNRKRFLSVINFIYSPSVLPGFHLGISRAVHQYVPIEGLVLDDYLTALDFGDRQTEGNDSQNQMVSLYFRWVFPESGAEIYGEYYREDSFFDMRDLFLEPDHDRAYTIGAQKIIKSSRLDFFKINLELNNLVPSRVDEVRPQTYYYRHSQIQQGHTNGGQVLGAAIGPGSGSQYLGVEGYFDNGMVGMFLQRVEENDFFHFDFYDRPNSGTGHKDFWRHRINLNIGLKGHYKHGPLLFSGKLVWNKNFNYGRFNLGDLDVDFDSVDKNDIVNIHMQISALYLF